MLHPTLMKMPVPDKRADKVVDIDAKVANRTEKGGGRSEVVGRTSFQDWYARQDKAARSDLKKGNSLPAERAGLVKNNKLDRVENTDGVKAGASALVDSLKDEKLIGPGLVHNGLPADSLTAKQVNAPLVGLLDKSQAKTIEKVATQESELSELQEDPVLLTDPLIENSKQKQANVSLDDGPNKPALIELEENNVEADILGKVDVDESGDNSPTGNFQSGSETGVPPIEQIDDGITSSSEEFQPFIGGVEVGQKESAQTKGHLETSELNIDLESELTSDSDEDVEFNSLNPEAVLTSDDTELDDDSLMDESEKSTVMNQNNSNSQNENKSEKNASTDETILQAKNPQDETVEEGVATVAANKTGKPDADKVSTATGDNKNSMQADTVKSAGEGDRSLASERIKQFSGEKNMQSGQGEKLTLEQSALKDSGDHEQDFKQQVLQRVEVAKKVVEIPVRQPVGHADWAKSIGDRMMMMVSRNMKVANIRLDPPNLGLMEVKIAMGQDQQTQITFVSQHAQVREVLEAESPRLRQMLEEQGLGQVDVDVSDRNEQDSSMFGDGPGSNQSGDQGDGVEVDEEIVEQVSLGLVDHYV